MFHHTSIKYSFQQLQTSLSLQNIVVDLDPQHEESLSGGANKEDLATLQRLTEEFAAELATLRGRVDQL